MPFTKPFALCAAASFALINLLGCASDTPRADASPSAAESRPAPAVNKDGWVYMIRLSRPDILETATEAERAAFAGHVAYIKDLTSRGVIIVAGPTTDEPPLGLVIFEAPSAAAAREIMLGDPGVSGGVFIAELHPMRLSSLRERDMPKP